MRRRDFHKLALGTAASALAPGLSSQSQAAPSFSRGDAGRPAPKFSVMLWTLPKGLSFEQKLQVAAEAGYDGVEVGNEYEQWTPAEWKRNQAMLQALGLVVDAAVPGRNSLANHDRRTALREDLLRAIPGARQLGCRQFIYTAWTRVPGQTQAVQRAAIVDSLRYAADLLEKDRIEIVLEPIDLLEYPQEAVPSVVEAAAITRAVGSPRVKVLYDFFHEQRQAGNLIETLVNSIDQIGLVHIADVPGRHRPGTGEINYSNVYRQLAAPGYDGTLCMEFLPQWNAVDELRTARVEALRVLHGA